MGACLSDVLSFLLLYVCCTAYVFGFCFRSFFGSDLALVLGCSVHDIHSTVHTQCMHSPLENRGWLGWWSANQIAWRRIGKFVGVVAYYIYMLYDGIWRERSYLFG
jgi:hypothetical protein